MNPHATVRLELVPGQNLGRKGSEREQALAEALSMLSRARDQRDEWYVWVLERWRPYRLGQRDVL